MQPTPLNPDCDTLWNKYSTWNDTVKQGLKNYALASMDALIYPFFWTWKVSCVLGYRLRGVHQHPLSFILIWLTIGVSASTLAPAPVLACFFHAISLTPKITPIFFFSPLCHLVSSSVIVAVLLAPRSRVGCPGPCSGDSVPCITLCVSRLFSHNSLERQASNRSRIVRTCGVLRSFHFPRYGVVFLFFVFHVSCHEKAHVHICTPLRLRLLSSMNPDSRNNFRSSNHSIVPSCDHPLLVLSCHGTKLKF